MTWKKIKNLIPSEPPEDGLDDESSKIPQDIVKFVEKFRIIKGKLFSFKDREYLYEMYRDPAKEKYIVKGRQTEITEFAINWLLYQLLTHPNSVGLYASDRDQHVKVFSRDRLRKGAIWNSKLLRSFVKEENERYVEFTNGSVLHMISGWDDFEEARSLAVDFAVIDEIQSLNVSAIPVLRESLSKSEYGLLTVIGTGSDYGDDWWQMWHRGSQKEWNSQTKKWDAKNPESDGISSYRISQYMVPDISNVEIEKKKKGSPPRYIATEIEGQWHKGARRPLTTKEMMTLFDRNLDLTPAEEVNHNLPIYVGIDWGGGTQAHTVVWIWKLVNENVPRFKLLHLEKIDDPSTENQADRAIELIRRFEVDQVVMDAGGGTRQVEKLSKTFGSRIFKVNYRYDAANPVEIFRKEHRLNCDRTWIIETIIDLIKRPEPNANYPDGIPKIHLPYKDPEKTEWIIDNFTCIEAETSNAGGKEFVKYVHPESMPDDALHAAGYAYLAWVVHQGQGWSWVRF